MGRALEETLRQLERLADPSHEQVILILTDGLNQPPRESPYFAPIRGDTRPRPRAAVGLQRAFPAPGAAPGRQGLARPRGRHRHGDGRPEARRRRSARGTRCCGSSTRRSCAPASPASGTTRSAWSGSRHPPRPWRRRRDRHRRRSACARAPTRTARSSCAAPGSRRSRVTAWHGRRRRTLGARGQRCRSPVGPSRPRHEARFEARLSVPADLPPGDYDATLTFEQESAVKLLPARGGPLLPRARLSGSCTGEDDRRRPPPCVLGTVGLVLYRRRPVPVTLVVGGRGRHASSRCASRSRDVLPRRRGDGSLPDRRPAAEGRGPGATVGRPLRARLDAARDRADAPRVPARGSAGGPGGERAGDRRTVRFVRWRGAASGRARGAAAPRRGPRRTAGAGAPADVDFR